jgi:hypothetical protein
VKGQGLDEGSGFGNMDGVGVRARDMLLASGLGLGFGLGPEAEAVRTHSAHAAMG